MTVRNKYGMTDEEFANVEDRRIHYAQLIRALRDGDPKAVAAADESPHRETIYRLAGKKPR